MEEIRKTQAPSGGLALWKKPWKNWAPRLVLWTLAVLIGLWLGTSARPVAAKGGAPPPAARSEASIADVFRLDILLAGKESTTRRAAPKPAPVVRQYTLPEAVLCAQRERPEPVPSVMPKTLSSAHSRIAFALPPKPSGAWQLKMAQVGLEARMAHVERIQQGLQSAFATVPAMSPDNRRTIQVELDKACAQLERFETEDRVAIPELPELPTGETGIWRQTRMARPLP